ncbi:MAG: helix-turn-helix domain-containing protein [Oscillospiraceae bacterium]
MITFGQQLKEMRKRKRITQAQLAEMCHVSQGTIANWEAGNRQPDLPTVSMIADVMEITVDKLIGRSTPSEPSNISAVYEDHIRMVPVFESVSAGFGALAENSVVDFIPLRIVSDYEASETICIRVQGDSMFPKIENGDIIQVHKQESVDSGDIAVVLLDGDEGLVKKVVYGSDWIELHSINPMYPVQRFEKADVLRLRVVGKVKGVFKAL